jgi:hypothetical protein
MADRWIRLAAEFERREVDELLAELRAAGLGQTCYTWVDSSLDKGVECCEDRAFQAWQQVAGRGELALLLATYVYSRAQRAWELSTAYVRINRTVEAAWKGWQRTAEADVDGGTAAVGLLLRHALSLRDCMEAERALNCSCPIYMADMARNVVSESDDLLEESGLLGSDASGFREHFLDPVLRSHREYYTAVARSAEAVSAWVDIDEGTAARRAVHDAADFVRCQEQHPDVRRDVYASELRAHRKVLETVMEVLDDPSVPTVRLDEANVCYQYPFALEGMDGQEVLDWVAKREIPHTSELSDIWTWSKTRPPSTRGRSSDCPTSSCARPITAR